MNNIYRKGEYGFIKSYNIIMRIRCAGLVKIDEGYALMHRLNVAPTPGTSKPYGEYYVIPGGGLEGKESKEEATIRELEEEMGVKVKVIKELMNREFNDGGEEHLFLCEYVSGEFGTGTGPEFSNDPRYASRGQYIPTIVKAEDFGKIRLFPEEFKENLVRMFEKGDL